jgi:NAD(P)-dependent dehydrogenase (short-subunit alcohol dehydrogenase family)
MTDYLDKFRLDGITAFVMGGLGLIGREVSIAFSSAGAKTIILDQENEEAEIFVRNIKRQGYDVHFRPFDCSDMEQLEHNFSNQLNEFGYPHVFINCSYPQSIDWGKSSFKEITLASFRKNVDIHMNSYAWLARLAANAMVEAGNGGSVIQLGSIYGIVGQDLTIYEGTDIHENMTYAAIKGGITNLTRQMASYYGQFNIRVNTICPGGLQGHMAGRSNTQEPRFVEQYIKKTPLKRMGSADEVASTALFLACNASSYISGSSIVVDGGWTII